MEICNRNVSLDDSESFANVESDFAERVIVRVYRGHKMLRSADQFVPGEILSLRVLKTQQNRQHLIQISPNSRIVNGLCEGLRTLNSSIVIKMPNKTSLENVRIYSGWLGDDVRVNLSLQATLIHPNFQFENNTESIVTNSSSVKCSHPAKFVHPTDIANLTIGLDIVNRRSEFLKSRPTLLKNKTFNNLSLRRRPNESEMKFAGVAVLQNAPLNSRVSLARTVGVSLLLTAAVLSVCYALMRLYNQRFRINRQWRRFHGHDSDK